MKAVVFAYHNIGVIGIKALIDAGFEIPFVFTHEDNDQENIWFSSVAELCKTMGILTVTPENPDSPEWLRTLKVISPDIIFSFYYRKMISTELLDVAPLGAYILHGSCLPSYRGRCPVNWVIINGEDHTGVTLHEMVEKPDAGPIVARERIEIAPDETAPGLFSKLEDATSRMLPGILPRMLAGDIPKTPQDLHAGSYFGGRRPEDGKIDWNDTAHRADCLIRGVTRPYPGAFGYLDYERLIIWKAGVQDCGDLIPGMIDVRDGLNLIGTSKGALAVREMEYQKTILQGPELSGFFKQHKGEILK